MKMVVAGGRNLYLTKLAFQRLDEIVIRYGITDVVTGYCPTGVDSDVYKWAKSNEYIKKIHLWPAQWDLFGREAGPLRNRLMVKFVGRSGVGVFFKGGAGTYSCRYHAGKQKMTIVDLSGTEYVTAN